MKGGEAALPFVDKALQALLPILKMKLDPEDRRYEHMGGLRDNASSAVAKILLNHTKQAQVTTVLPIFLAALPLQVDMEENNFVYSSVIKILHTFPKAFPGLVETQYPQILEIFNDVLTTKPLKDTLKAFMAKTAFQLLKHGEHGRKLRKLMASWPTAKREPLERLLAAVAAAKSPAAATAAVNAATATRTSATAADSKQQPAAKKKS